ncbi:MAG: hypothetical protein WCW35_06965 [Bacteroidota bacterium]|jgi:hypothetical protein
MKTNSRTLRLFLLCLLWIAALSAQETDEAVEPEKKKERFAIAFGAAAGNFANDAANFTSIYSNRSISRIYFAGIGSSSFLFVGKYREFFAHGSSKVENIAVTGKAEWKQKFYSAGIRVRSNDQPIYAEVLYVITRAEESLTTVDPVVQELTSRYETENKGVGFAVGFALKLIGPIGIYAEGEFSAMLRGGRNPQGKADPELGGFCASAGLFFAL